MLSLLEALGKTQQTQRGLFEFGHVGNRPLGFLQALPRLQNLPSLMNDPLGKVMLETIAARVFELGHIQTTVDLLSEMADGAMLAPPIRQKSAVSHLFDNILMAHSHYSKSID
ncbi:Transcriptional regulator [Pseudomonas syringae pv. actinidiae]|uniref:Transcriptional regulator n=1 Tax=Pseudomonas syringae pv. actinidiae TaxID=103796 RepID=A0AAN4TJ75_PSESF|nr:Transcriptional regulator [Pseudomonas syringae pv. actinidiae]